MTTTQQLFFKSTTKAWFLTEKPNRFRWSSNLTKVFYWTATNITITSGETDPLATLLAYKLVSTDANATLAQNLELLGDARNRVFSIYVKRLVGAGAVELDAGDGTWTAVTVTGAWTRVSASKPLKGSVTAKLRMAVSGDEIAVAFPQYEDAMTPTAYEATTAVRRTVTEITDTDYPVNTVRGCAFLDGRFFVMTPKGEIQHSALEDAATWNALDFIQSQSDPSDGVYLGKSNSYIVAFKDWSIEFFYDAANPVGSILSPVQNAAVQIGCSSSGAVQDMGGGSLIFMGHTRTGFGRSIYNLTGTTPAKISTPAVEKYLNADSLATVYSWTAQVGSHSLYAVTLVTTNKTLVYDFSTQRWSLFSVLREAIPAGTWSVTGIAVDGLVTVTDVTGLTDGMIVKLTDAGEFSGWHLVMTIDTTTNTFRVQKTGAAFVGAAIAAKWEERYSPFVQGIRAHGRQYLQNGETGVLNELTVDSYSDTTGPILVTIRTDKVDGGALPPKVQGVAEVIGDKIDSVIFLRSTDDDYQTFSKFRPVDLSANRSRVRRMGRYNRRAFELVHLAAEPLRLESMEIGE